MPRYRLTSDAVQDLDAIQAYLLRQGGAAVARYVLRELRGAFQFLAANPDAGHRRQDLTDAPVKFWTVFSYLVIYDPAKRPIEVLNVLHSARDIPYLLDDG
jgi:plasmid stabilization system protein ParE